MKSRTPPAAVVKQWTLLLSSCAFLLSGVDAQIPAITLNDYDQSNAVTSCPVGLLEGTDSFMMTGMVDTTGVTTSDYLTSLTVQTRLPMATHFSDVLCTFTSTNCDPTPRVNECYCSGQSSSSFNFVINKTVEFVHSNNEIRVQWEAVNIMNTAVSEPKTLTTFYQVAELVYAGANDDQNRTISASGQCAIPQSSSITFCALNLEVPFTITFAQGDQTPISSTSSCLTANDAEAAINISYAESAGCQRSQVISCAIDASTESTPTSSPEAPSEGSSSGCNKGCIIGIAVAVPVFLIVVLASVLYSLHIKNIITLPCLKKKPMPPPPQNNRTTNGGNLPEKNERKFTTETSNKLPPINEMSKPRSPAHLQQSSTLIMNPSNELPPKEDGVENVQKKKKRRKKQRMSNGTPAEKNDQEIIRGEKNSRDGGRERDRTDGRRHHQSPRPLPSPGEPVNLEAHNTSVTDLHRLNTNFTTHSSQGLDRARPTSIEFTSGPGQNVASGRPLPVRR